MIWFCDGEKRTLANFNLRAKIGGKIGRKSDPLRVPNLFEQSTKNIGNVPMKFGLLSYSATNYWQSNDIATVILIALRSGTSCDEIVTFGRFVAEFENSLNLIGSF